MAGESRLGSVSLPDSKLQICIIGENLKQNKSLITAAENFGIPVVYSDNGLEFINHGGEYATIYILEEFEGEVYESLHAARQRILGPTVVMECAEKKEALPNKIRPVYTRTMKNLTITLSGFRLKEELSLMVSMIHHMDGSVRKDVDIRKTTHLVATPSAAWGEKYKTAAPLFPIMSSQWIHECWARRHLLNCSPIDEELMQFKLLPFVRCKIAFIGYQEEEEQHMKEVAVKNGGEICDCPDSSCTHIVVEDGCTAVSTEYNQGLHMVQNEWFWASIQLEAKADESLYPFRHLNIVTSSSTIVPVKGNKRKRNENIAHQLAMESFLENEYFSFSSDLQKNSDIVKLSISGSFLDGTLSPDKSLDISTDGKEFESSFLKSPPPMDMQSLSGRQRVCFELFQTESNYVGILNTIITVFKEPLEDPNQIGGPLLAPAEVKIIFGNLPPIYEIHQKIRTQLTRIIHGWSGGEDDSIGEVILSHSSDFMKAYPPFVNFLEKTKMVLTNCDSTKPRFHAFLKRCQSKPECGRQTLQELLIRPVQRLPSVLLLLDVLLKHTPTTNLDYEALKKAIAALTGVMTHINEGKRKTEGHVAMFDVVNDIENCPPYLLSSHRNLVSKTDMQEATDLLTKKGGTVTMFLFTDVLEICKKRRVTSSLKSPGVVSLASGSLKAHVKSFKHLDLIPLSHIKRVVDVTETEECKNVFAIVAWSPKELKELLYAFILIDDVCKCTFLHTLCRQIANSVCKADIENLLTNLDPQQLALQTSESTGNMLLKALRKTRGKLDRALSLRRTPSTRRLSRAVSTMISPLRNFGTPSHNMPSLKLSSVTNLTEFDAPPPSLSSSPVRGKKLKSSSLGISMSKLF